MNPGSKVDMEGWPLVEVDRHGVIPVKPHVAFLIEKDRSEACPQRTPEWYEKRSNHLTASAIASAVGKNKYESRLSTLRKKIGFGEAFKGNEATEHGNKYEFEAIKKYENMTGEKQIEFGLLESIKNEHKGTFQDTSWLAGSPDGITATGRLLEVKCPFRRIPNGTVPDIYVYQIQGLMHMLDLPICDFIEYVPEGTWQVECFSIVTVVRSDLFWETNFPIMQRFWDSVLEKRERIRVLGKEAVDEETKEKTREVKKRKVEKKMLIEPPPAVKISKYFSKQETSWPAENFVRQIEQAMAEEAQNEKDFGNGCLIDTNYLKQD